MGRKNGRSAASQWCDPRARSGAAGVHVLLAGRDRLRLRDEHLEIRRRRVRDGAQSVGRPRAARLPAIHAQPRADREGGLARARRDADGARPGERRREGAVAGQAGARPRLLRHRVAAYLDRGRGLQRGRGVPLSAPEDREELRAGRHPRRRPDRRGALLGPVAAGILREGRRVAARSEGRDFRDPADRGHARRRQSSTRC